MTNTTVYHNLHVENLIKTSNEIVIYLGLYILNSDHIKFKFKIHITNSVIYGILLSLYTHISVDFF